MGQGSLRQSHGVLVTSVISVVPGSGRRDDFSDYLHSRDVVHRGRQLWVAGFDPFVFVGHHFGSHDAVIR